MSLRIRLTDVDDHVRGAVIVRIWPPPDAFDDLVTHDHIRASSWLRTTNHPKVLVRGRFKATPSDRFVSTLPGKVLDASAASFGPLVNGEVRSLHNSAAPWADPNLRRETLQIHRNAGR